MEGEEKNEDYLLFQVTGQAPCKPLLASMLINGVPIEMEIVLPHHPSVSLMGEDTYGVIKDSDKPLMKFDARLHTYTGEPIYILGSTEVSVEQIMSLPLIFM